VPQDGEQRDQDRAWPWPAFSRTARDRIKKLLDKGKSEQDVLASNPLADLDHKWAAPRGVASNPICNE
jgi:hypothetical protein